MTSDYYPFGMLMEDTTNWRQDTSYRFGFNGQEQDNEMYGEKNSTTAEFWQYDSRLGRRWNIDPIFIASLSSYATFGNNPINNIDPNGDTFDKSNNSDKKVEQHKNRTKGLMKSNSDKIADNKKQIQSLKEELKVALFEQQIHEPVKTMRSDGSVLEAKIACLQNQIGILESRNSDLKMRNDVLEKHLKDIGELERSSTVYSLYESTDVATVIAPNDKVVNIYYFGTYESMGQELTHASQYERGTDALAKSLSARTSPTWDIYDELEAYKVENALQSSPDKLFGPMRNVTTTNIIKMFPIYNVAPKARLNTSSSLGEIQFQYRLIVRSAMKTYGNITLKEAYILQRKNSEYVSYTIKLD
jgi:RHS repeat-associated protein